VLRAESLIPERARKCQQNLTHASEEGPLRGLGYVLGYVPFNPMGLLRMESHLYLPWSFYNIIIGAICILVLWSFHHV